jgi:hypothetical protein
MQGGEKDLAGNNFRIFHGLDFSTGGKKVN